MPAPAAAAHSDIQAIIARPPAQLTRWGNTILLLIVGSVLASLAFIRYAERISVPLQLTALAPPVPVALAPGLAVGQLCVPPRALVEQGQLLGYTADSGASVPQLLGLARTLSQPGSPALPAYRQLGALQAGYEALGRLAPLRAGAAYVQQRAVLQQRVRQWLAAHTLRAPATGRVSYGAWPGAGAPARPGQAPGPRLYILPVVQLGTEVGTVRIMQRQLRYLKERQQVEVSFEAYPAGEFGTVPGQLAQIADLPDEDGSYQALVAFPHGLRTSTNQHLVYRAGMHATAELVVAYRPLLWQLFPLLRKAS